MAERIRHAARQAPLLAILACAVSSWIVLGAPRPGQTDATPALSAVPATPVLKGTRPASPANNNNPTAYGAAPTNSTVRLYKSGDCSGTVEVSGSDATFKSPGLAFAIADDHTTKLSVTATVSGNTSACSNSITYVEDSTPPDTTITDGPTGVISNPTPTFAFDSSEPNSTFRCRFDSAAYAPCSGPGQTHTPSTPLADGTHTFWVRATDAARNADKTPAGRQFAVSTQPLQAPVLTTTSPASPANNNSPKVLGNATSGTTVTLYKSSDCSGAAAVQGSAATLKSPGLAISVADNTTTDLSATVTDGGGTVSSCSSPISYVEDSTAPDTTITSGPSGATKSTTPTFGFASSEPNSTFQCRFDSAAFGPCSGPGQTHTATSALAEGSHTFSVRAFDAAKNVDASPATRRFSVDTTAPAAPNLTATSPKSPANSNTPAVLGTAESGATIRIYTSEDCTGAVAGQGSAAQLASPGIKATVPSDATTTLSATATDAAGNGSPCSNMLSYSEDSTPPDTALDSSPPPRTLDPDLRFTFSSPEPGATFQCRLDGATFAACASPKTYANVADGEHTFQVRALDAVGNPDATPAQASFTIAANTVPNILLIITDDQPLDTMFAMPNTLSRFAAGGIEYTQGYDTTPLCCPSRSSIFSGKYTHNHGITMNDGTAFDASETWQRYLHDQGYYTGILGKYLSLVSAGSAPYFDFRRSVSQPDDPTEPDLFADSTDAFLKQTESTDRQPWALVYAPHSPHAPWVVQPHNPIPYDAYDPPPSYQEPDVSDKDPAVAAYGSSQFAPRLDTIRDGQLLELEATDEALGKVYSELDSLNEWQNTLAIFISDNGYLWLQHQLYAKEWPYLESIHVPFYVSWPGHVQPGTVSNDLVANIDIAPTIYQATGIQPGYPVDGQSLFGSQPRDWLLAEFPESNPDTGMPGWASYVSPTRQYIDYTDGFTEDYDLTQDPYELSASNTQDPVVEQQLQSALSCVGAVECP